MTREEIYSACETALTKSNTLLLESATGTGKSRIAISLVNWISSAIYKNHKPKMLLLVAKIVHKQTWKDEFAKWGGINADVTMECYESLHKHQKEHFDIILADEVHHLSEARMTQFKTLSYGYIIGLSATIPQKMKMWFRYCYHAEIVSCDLTEAIEDSILPEPQILLFPLKVESSRISEILELHTKAKGPTVHCEYKDLRKYKFKNVHVICKCTQQQKLNELDSLISWTKDRYMKSGGSLNMKQSWLYFCGKRLEFLADCKLQWIKLILHHLRKERTITFCKTIAQTEQLGKNCIHSQNKEAMQIYNDFNSKKINHITTVNILNENANLVDCKYAIFCNISSSDTVQVQRTGRALRHKSPVIIIPYYENTREQEVLEQQFKDFDKTYIRTIHSVNEI